MLKKGSRKLPYISYDEIDRDLARRGIGVCLTGEAIDAILYAYRDWQKKNIRVVRPARCAIEGTPLIEEKEELKRLN